MKYSSTFLLVAILVGCQGEESQSLATTPRDAPSVANSTETGDGPMASDLESSFAESQSVQERLSGLDATVVPSPDGGIRSVIFEGTDVSQEAIDMVVQIPELVILSLSGTSVGDTEMKRISKLTNLQILLIGDTQVTDDGVVHLKSLTSLQRLGLGGTEVTDAGLNHLQGLTYLRKLFLGETNVTNEGIAAFQAAVPECQIER